MDKLDRLGWTAAVCFVCHGLRIGVRANTPKVLDQLLELLPPGAKPTRGPRVQRLYSVIAGGAKRGPRMRRFNMLYVDEVRLVQTTDWERVRIALEMDLQLYVAEFARRRVFVHAGVVGWRGRAIVIPGRSLSGKTTLVRALVEAGATFQSDEYAVLDSRGRVHPYVTKMSLRDAAGGHFEKVHPETLGWELGVRPLPIGLVVVTSHRSGARWRPRRLSAGRAVMELLAHTVSARWQPERALATLRLAIANAKVIKGMRGEAEEIADALLSAAADGTPSISTADSGRRVATSAV
jgi:hypothetical protein